MTQHKWDNTRNLSHVQRLKILHEITTAVTSNLDLDAVLKTLLERIDQLLPYHAASVKLYNKERGTLEPVICKNMDVETWKSGYSRGLVREIIEQRVPVTSSDVQSDPRVRNPEFFRKHGLVSFIGLPLVVNDELKGVLSLYTKERHEFDTEEIEFLSMLASQATIAIHNSQLYEQINNQAVENAKLVQAYWQKEVRLRERDQQLSALHFVTTAASESLDLDAVLHEVIREITEIFNFDATRIYLMNRQMTELNLRASFETNPKFFANYTVFQKGQGNIGFVAATGKPLIYENVQHDPLYDKLSHTKGIKRGGFSLWAGFPIRTKLTTVGAIACIGVKPRRLKAEEVQLITSMANQIAIGVRYAVLFEESQTTAREVSLLYYVAKVVNQSLDLKTLLCGVMHEVRKLFKFDVGRIGLLEANGKDLGILADEGRLRKIVPPNREIMKKVLEARRPLFFENIQTDPLYKKWTVNKTASKEGFRAAFYLPIRGKEKTLGVIGFLGKDAHRFSPEEVRLIYSIADHLGTAVENARLYEAVRHSREELRELATRIQVAREEERSRLARQVHDDLGQPLTALKMELAMASGILARNPKAGEKTTKPFFDLIDGMVKTVRNIGEELRPAVLDDLGLTEAINWQAEDFQRRTGIQSKVTGRVGRNSLDPGRSVAVFRIFQEILSNVARHARADKIKVEWKKDSANMLLMVSDNGKGITARALTNNSSFGILGMRERALFCRGELNISGIPGKGTTVSLRIPAH